jgi:hypothetical protein
MCISDRSHFVLTSGVSLQQCLLLVNTINIIHNIYIHNINIYRRFLLELVAMVYQAKINKKLIWSLKTMRQQLVVSQLIYLSSFWSLSPSEFDLNICFPIAIIVCLQKMWHYGALFLLTL